MIFNFHSFHFSIFPYIIFFRKYMSLSVRLFFQRIHIYNLSFMLLDIFIAYVTHGGYSKLLSIPYYTVDITY